jgi:hypothetical protein
MFCSVNMDSSLAPPKRRQRRPAPDWCRQALLAWLGGRQFLGIPPQTIVDPFPDGDVLRSTEQPLPDLTAAAVSIHSPSRPIGEICARKVMAPITFSLSGQPWDWALTAPRQECATRAVLHCLARARACALLLRMSLATTKAGSELLSAHPPDFVLACAGGSRTLGYAWFVWTPGARGGQPPARTELHVLRQTEVARAD